MTARPASVVLEERIGRQFESDCAGISLQNINSPFCTIAKPLVILPATSKPEMMVVASELSEKASPWRAT